MGLYAGRERLLYTGLQNLAAVHDCSDVWNGAHGRVLQQDFPIAVVCDQPWPILRHFLVQQLAHGHRQCFQDFPLFDGGDPEKGVDVIRVNREQPHELIHVLVHPAIKPRESSQVFAYAGLLVRALSEQALGDHIFHIATGDQHLLEAIFDTAQAVGGELESRAVEDGFLDASDKPKAKVFGHLPNLAQ